MKVTLVGHYPPPYGGVASLMKQMESALRASGTAVSIFNLGAGRPEGPDVVNFDTRNRLRESFQLLRAFALSESEVHHYLSASYRSFWLGSLCVLLARLAGRRIVMSIVGGAFNEFVSSMGPARRKAAAATLGLCHAVIACNEDIREALRALVPGKHVHTMTNCFPLVSGGVGELPDSVERFARSHSPLISTTGAASVEYGLLDAAEGLRRLRESLPGAGLVVAVTKYGDRGYEQELLTKLETAGLSDHFLIERDLPDFTSVMKRSDVFLRSTLVDGDSISVREALLLGVPVVASDTPFRPEGVILFRKGDPGDMALKLLRVLEADSKIPAADAREESEGNLRTLLGIYAAVRRTSSVPPVAGKRPYSNHRPGYEA